MAAYWYAFLIPGVLLLGVAFVVQLLNMRNFLKGGGEAFKSFADTPDPDRAFDASLNAVKDTGKKVAGGLVVVALTGLLGAVLTIIGFITLIVHLTR